MSTITKKQLFKTISSSAYAKQYGNQTKIILNKEEMQAYLDLNTKAISTVEFKYNDKWYWFYSDDYCHGKGITWGTNKLVNIDPIPSRLYLPYKVIPREGLIDGLVKTLDEFIFVFRPNDHQITSVEEYLEILNNNLLWNKKTLIVWTVPTGLSAIRQ